MLHDTNELLVTFLCLEEHIACCLSADCDGPSDQKICDHEVAKRLCSRRTQWFIFIDVEQFLGSIKATLGSLLERYTGAEITNKLGTSILATVFRQLVIHLSHLIILICFLARF